MTPFIHGMWVKVAKLVTRHYIRIMYATSPNKKTAYNARLAAQIVAYFALKSATRDISVLKVVKLVYLSDRLSMEKYFFPILTERRVSMEHGPVNSQTYNNIKQDRQRAVGLNEWSKFVTPVHNRKVAAMPNLSIDEFDELSDAHIKILDAVWEKFEHMTPSQIRNWTHKNCPEYKEIETGSEAIDLITFASNSGLSLEQYEQVKDQEVVDIIFASIAL